MTTPLTPSVCQDVLLFGVVVLGRNRQSPILVTVTRVGRLNVAIERYGARGPIRHQERCGEAQQPSTRGMTSPRTSPA